MRKDGRGIYSNEVVTALLSFFMKEIGKEENACIIELGNELSRLLNDADTKQEYLGFEEQKAHILDLARDINKKKARRLSILNIKEKNPELFKVLSSQ